MQRSELIFKINNQFLVSLCINFILCVFYGAHITYINVLFLSSYPSSMLPYLYIGAGTLTTFLIIAIPLSLRYSLVILHFISAILIVIFIGLLHLKIKEIPLLFSIVLESLAIINMQTVLNTINRVFDVREYKQYGIWITVAGTLGNIVGGFLTPLILIYFSSMYGIAYFMLILLIIAIPFSFELRPQEPTILIRESGKVFPRDYPLFLSVSIFMLLIGLTLTFADYNFKQALQSTLTKKEIGLFTGIFFAISNIFTLLLELIGTNKILKRFGVVSILAIFPICGILVAAAAVAKPSLATATLVYGSLFAVFNSYIILSREILFNILPIQIRLSRQYQIRALLRPAGILLAGGMIGLFVSYANIRSVSIIIIIVSISLLFYIKKVRADYIRALRKSLKTKRFGTMLQYATVTKPKTLKKIVLQALDSRDPDINRFGLSLLRKIYFKKAPKTLRKLIDSPFTDIRIEAIDIIHVIADYKPLKYLEKRLKIEKDPEVIWHLMDTLATLQTRSVLTLAVHYLSSPIPQARAGAIRILTTGIRANLYSEAVTELKKMTMSPEPEFRSNAGRVIGASKLSDFTDELKKLIVDKDDNVCISALHSAIALDNPNLIPFILTKLGAKQTSYHALQALVHFNEHALPYLIENLKENEKPLPVTLATLHALAAIPSSQVEDYFHELITNKNLILVQTLAKHLVFRAQRFSVTENFRNMARALAFKEVKRIQVFMYLKTQNLDDFITAEIISRQQLAEYRYLCWFAICTNPTKVLQFMPDILKRTSFKPIALELLDTYTKDRLFAQTLTEVFEKKHGVLESKDKASIEKYLDDWLKTVFKFKEIGKEGKDMLMMQRVFLLRSVLLFEDLPAESLLEIAQEAQQRDMIAGETIFSEGDSPNGLYIIVSGKVEIRRKDQVLSQLKKNDFFGELALIDSAPRFATALAKSDGILLFLDKYIFDRITDDLPEVLKNVTHVMLGYLRANMGK